VGGRDGGGDNASEKDGELTVTSSPVGDFLEEHVRLVVFIEAKPKHTSLSETG